MSNKILQWNCRGIRANYEELLLLLNKFNPKVVCLQEAFLKDKNQLHIKHFLSYNHLYKDGHRVSAGISILVRKDIPQSQIHVDTDLQATLHKPIHICSIYIPPHDSISDIKMNELLQQIPKPFLLLKSFNCLPPVLFLSFSLSLADCSPPIPFLSLTLTCNINTLVCVILQRSNQQNAPLHNASFIPVLG